MLLLLLVVLEPRCENHCKLKTLNLVIEVEFSDQSNSQSLTNCALSICNKLFTILWLIC